MSKIKRFIAGLRKFFRTWVVVKDEPEKPKAGELYVRTPDGKTVITVDITTLQDEVKAKRLVDLVLSDIERWE